ncbi:MAG TPA: 2-dehydropantoate 2-reductase N-terminal domain-containing protein, partial [Bacillales bacterium]|nr:2-dehydropantoate 2-reductase N-terminal domain-containing protein [Bacillales bacterium]
MNIVILGAGAVGGYIGARLIEAGEKVSFLVRNRRAEQLKRHGLTLDSVQGDYAAEQIDCYTAVEAVQACDVVIVTIKGYHIEGALPQLRKLAAKGAKILPFLNGMEHFQQFEEEFGKENVIGGLAFIIATLNETGGVVHTSEMHDFIFGPLDPSQMNICARLEVTLRSANLNVSNSNDILT